MKIHDHIRLVWTRPCVGGATLEEFVFDDGLPPPTAEELEATREQALALWNAERQALAQWDNVQEFMATLTMEEKAKIALSTDPTIAALRLELSTWLSSVHPADARVQAGLDRLVQCFIITADRKAEILNTAHAA
jgi:hypothetical protein